MKKSIALISSLDTKMPENLFAKELLEKKGYSAFVIDISTRDPRPEAADLTSAEILNAYGVDRKDFYEMDRSTSIGILSEALSAVIPDYYKNGDFQAILSIGGGQNALMAASAMKNLPYGVPKLIVSPLISGKRELEQYVFDRDIMVMHSVGDFSGINTLTASIITNAVGAICGMADTGRPFERKPGKKVVGVSMLGVTSAGASEAMAELERSGVETMVFHANGTGGRCFENLIRAGVIDAALDINLHELTCELLGGYCTGADHRLETAAQMGIPIVFAPGAMDIIDYYMPKEAPGYIPEGFERRQKMYHNPSVCHTKIFEEEAVLLAKTAAERLNAAKGPVTAILPLRGFCEAGAPGKALHNQYIDGVFIETLKMYMNKNITVKEIDANINDPACARLCAQSMLELLQLSGVLPQM